VRGATVLDAGAARFSLWAPRANAVDLVVGPADHRSNHLLARGADGVHEGVLEGVVAGSDYAYRLDGGPPRADPVSRLLPEGLHGPSRLVDPRAFAWSDAGWRGIAMADAIIYELHIGTFTTAGTFDGAIERLGYLRRLGVTAIEILPVAQFPGTRNWGYDGASLYGVQHSYGGPEGLRRLVNAAHAAGLAVLMDVVYNHVGPEGNYLAEFGPYFSDRWSTGWGQGFNLDGSESDEVRRYIVDNATYWIDEYHADGLRLDAADRITDQGAVHLLEELAAAVHARGQALGRHTLVIAESDANDPRYVRSPEAGGYGLDAQWSDDFHHAVHAALTGEHQGYYADFGGTRPIAKAIAQRFVNDGRFSPHRRRRHGRPALDVPGDRFVICVQNHDQVGNRARGDRLATLVVPAALRLAAAILLLSPYVPLLFMGEEYGEVAPFLYFVGHTDPGLVEAVREGRRKEFAAFAWSGQIPDPADAATFEASRLRWKEAQRPAHAQLLALYTDLIALRKGEPALMPGGGAVAARVEGEGGVVVELGSGHSRLVALFNFTADALLLAVPDGTWSIALSTDASGYGGEDRSALASRGATLAPYSALLLRTGTA